MKWSMLVFSLLFFAGCASVTRGSYQEITVESNVPGALVELNGVELGYTPFRGKIKRDKAGQIKVSKPGYLVGNILISKKQNYNTISSGNMGLGLGAGSPFFTSGFKEDAQYRKRKSDYENRKERGETRVSEVEPTNFSFSYFVSGVFVASSMFGFMASTDLSTSASWEYSPSSFYVQLKEIEQSNSNYSEELSIRYFATMNHSQVAIDAGNGEYKEALENLMETKMDSEAAKQSINEALETSKGSQVLFGDALIERFRR
ncbi:MAG: PEGA domain-containing protein [Fibromonadaceae bacterium]|jgi:hypothetical protein|nr:PEGA domain-containing protein [Fibromonadaceae bacterium]